MAGGKKPRVWREKGKPVKPPAETAPGAIVHLSAADAQTSACGLTYKGPELTTRSPASTTCGACLQAYVRASGAEAFKADPPKPAPEPEGRTYDEAKKLERNPRGHNSDERDYAHTEDVWLYVAKPVTDLSRAEMRWGWGIRKYREYPPRLIVWREFVGRDKTWKRAFQDTYKIPMEVYRAILANAPAAEAATAEGAPDPNGDKVPF